MERRQILIGLPALAALALALVPIFQSNLLGTASAEAFGRFGPRPSPPAGGLQGGVAALLRAAGCTDASCAGPVLAGGFALALVLFAAAIAASVDLPLGLTVLVVAVVSPWTVVAGRSPDLLPGTLLLPACAAAAMRSSHRIAVRSGWLVLVAAAAGVRAAAGTALLPFAVLLAVSVPVLAVALGRRGGARGAARDAALVLGAALVGVAVAAVAGVVGLGGGDGLGTAGALSASLSGQGAPFLALGVEGPYPGVVLGPWCLWLLVVLAVAAPLASRRGRDPRAVPLAAALAAATIPPLATLILPATRSQGADPIVWVLMAVPVLIRVAAEPAVRSRWARSADLLLRDAAGTR